MQRLDILLFDGLLGDKGNMRLTRRGTDRFSGVLLSPHERLHILGGDKLNLMSKRFELARSIEGSCAGFDDHCARIYLREDCEKLIAHYPAL